jgi:hypothetical protein
MEDTIWQEYLLPQEVLNFNSAVNKDCTDMKQITWHQVRHQQCHGHRHFNIELTMSEMIQRLSMHSRQEKIKLVDIYICQSFQLLLADKVNPDTKSQ